MIKRLLFWVIWVPIGIALISLAVSNRNLVMFKLDPTGQNFFPMFELPLYTLLFAAFIIGLIIGGIITWHQQGVWRKKARMAERENKEITQSLQRVKLERAALLAPQDRS